MTLSTPRRGTAALAAVLALGLLAAPAASATTPAPDDPALEQTVDGGEATVLGQDVVTEGHVDVGPRFVDGVWTLQARDDRAVPPEWRMPDETVFHVTDAAILDAPDSPDFAFMGVEAGSPLYVVPQVQNQEVVWLGWNTQDPEVTQRIDRGATLRLDGVRGPGEFFLFLQEGVTGPPNVLWSTGEDYPQDLWMDVNSHVHANWVFTTPGVYALDVTMISDLTDGTHVEDPATLLFAVGSGTDPETAFAASHEAEQTPDPEATTTEISPEPTTTEPAEPTETAAPADDTTEAGEDSSATASVMVWVGLAALVLVATMTAALLRGRRARARAEAESDQRPGGDA